MDLEAFRLAEAFFARRDLEVLPVVRTLLWEAAQRWPEVRIVTQKSQVGLSAPRPFCALYPPRAAKDRAAHRLGLSLFLSRPLYSERVLQAAEPYPGRWTNHLVLDGPEDLDGELWFWIDEARQFRNANGTRSPAADGKPLP